MKRYNPYRMTFLAILTLSFSLASLAQQVNHVTNLNEFGLFSNHDLEYNSSGDLIFGFDHTPTTGHTPPPSNLQLQKYSPSGSLIWHRRTDRNFSAQDSEFQALALDPNDNIFMTGNYLGSDLKFMNQSPVLQGQSGFNMDFFLAKFNTHGQIQWMLGAQPDSSMQSSRRVNGIAMKDNGNVVIFGTFTEDFYIDTTLFSASQSAGNSSSFITEIDGSGNVLWNKTLQLHSAGTFRGFHGLVDLQADHDGNIYIAVGLDSALTYDNNIISSPSPNSKADITGIIKADHEGNYLKSEIFYSPESALENLQVDQCGNPILMGTFSDSLRIGNQNITAESAEDIFVAKLDSSLHCTWLQRHGSTESDKANGLAINDQNQIFISFDFWGSLSYSGNTFNAQSPEVAVVKLDSNGKAIWFNHTDGPNTLLQGKTMTMSPPDNIAFAAGYNGTLTLDNQNLSSNGDPHTFLAQMIDSDYSGNAINCMQNMSESSPDLERQRIGLYPNPVGNQMQLELPSSANYPMEVSVLNASQKIILKTQISGPHETISVESLQAGFYLLQTDDSRLRSVKFIKR